MRAQEFTQPESAGCVIVAEDTGRWCFQQRSDAVDDPGVWAAWGGGVEPGETLEQAVRRELEEEGGYTGSMTLEPLHKNSRYATFVARVPEEFEPKINYESKDWCWVEPGEWPSPLHPGLEQALTHLNENFADGKNPQDKGDSKRHGIPKHASLAQLDKIGNGSGRKAQLTRWQANMRRGRAK